MRLTALPILLLMLLTSCHSDKALKPLDLSGCDNHQYTRAKPLKDVATFVIAKTYTGADGSSLTKYYLDQPDVAGFAIPWNPCNMPDAYKKDKLAVRINGYTLTFPGMESANTDCTPIELTRIEVTSKN